ncbi:hypothetical protein LCGC14_0662860 [marine sediment metagenome]|uniref:TGF-beta propeptide domain-containing protein n=1 Tax=marine sediment metagenome TaxID=412755 RepID=A0A0F9TEG9_9ZZZZ
MAITLVHDCDVERRPDPTAYEGDWRDCYLESDILGLPSGFHDGTQVAVGVIVPGGKGSEYERRGLFLFDLNAFIPASATITAHVWHFYVRSTNAAAGHIFRAVRCRRTGWLEREATWNAWKTGSNWTSPGAGDTSDDRDAGVIDSIGTLATPGWKAIDLRYLVDDAWDNRNGICTFIMERFDSFLTAQGEVTIDAKNYQPYGPETHHLRITYTLDGRTFQAFVY